MAKAKKYSAPIAPPTSHAKVFHHLNIKGTDPKRQQFEPTVAEPIRQHKRMAGGCG